MTKKWPSKSRNCSFECDPGYRLLGRSYLRCVNDEWDSPGLPYCAREVHLFPLLSNCLSIKENNLFLQIKQNELLHKHSLLYISCEYVIGGIPETCGDEFKSRDSVLRCWWGPSELYWIGHRHFPQLVGWSDRRLRWSQCMFNWWLILLPSHMLTVS